MQQGFKSNSWKKCKPSLLQLQSNHWNQLSSTDTLWNVDTQQIFLRVSLSSENKLGRKSRVGCSNLQETLFIESLCFTLFHFVLCIPLANNLLQKKAKTEITLDLGSVRSKLKSPALFLGASLGHSSSPPHGDTNTTYLTSFLGWLKWW